MSRNALTTVTANARIQPCSRISIDNSFKGYQPESERIVSKFKVKENEMLKRLKPFYSDKLATALRNCLAAGYRPLYLPEIIQMRLLSSGDSWLWQKWFTTPSIEATGRTKQGTPIILYVHTENIFSNPANIDAAIHREIRFGYYAIPNAEFRRLLKLGENGETDKSGNRLVWVIDHEKLKSFRSKMLTVIKSVSAALRHHQILPFIGSEDLARVYLARFLEVYNKDEIILTDTDVNDISDQPTGRPLFVGDGNSWDGGFGGSKFLDLNGRFVGIPAERNGKD